MSAHFVVAQTTDKQELYTAHNKGKFFILWGGNRENFSKSDIHFRGNGYDFTIEEAKAHDKPKGWHADYFNPMNMTIPQTNLKLGYYLTDHYNISLSIDHMKYVMTQFQTASVDGYINLPESEAGAVFNGVYNHQLTELTREFLQFEHTDGLNYVHTELSRVDDFSKYLGIHNTDIFQVNITEGLGGGFLFPKTNSTLLGKQRNDAFHVAGFGLSAKAGLNLTFFKHFFIQGELKGGYIHMGDIRTTKSSVDKASQHFYFFERIVAIGGIFYL
ncbi:hypothetical protein [Pustulibacterium marinum]|nr:hypothetical protein [Pustulibacterium marinum]